MHPENIAYSFDVHDTLSSVGMSSQTGHYCRSKESHHGKTDDYFHLLVACIAPSSTLKITL